MPAQDKPGAAGQTPSVSPQDCAEALEKVLNSRAFAGSHRLRQFLEFVARQALDQPSGRFRESALGAEIFAKRGNFQPQLDAAVRVTATRVRSRLEAYYQNEGRFDSVVISLPHGYRPIFARRLLSSRPLSRGVRVFAGRGTELERLWESLQHALAGQPHLLCVVAEPGIGKTALVEHFLHHVRGRVPFNEGTGRCLRQTQAVQAYQPWLEILNAFGAAGPESRRLLSTAAPQWSALLSATTPSEVTPAPAALAREMAQLLRQAADQDPVILFLDDLHWADVSSVDLLNQTLANLESAPVLIIAAYRPSDMKIRSHPFLSIENELKMKGLCRELRLPELSPGAVQALLEQRFPRRQFGPTVGIELHRASGGNALCVNAMIEHALRRQWFVSNEAGWRFTAEPGFWRSELPDSVTAMAARKLEELDPDERQLLWVSSLQGVMFDSAITARTLMLSQEAVDHTLERLRRRHHLLRLRDRPGGVLAGDGYEFAHVLYFDALQKDVPPGQRSVWSGRTAQAVLEAYGEANDIQAATLADLFEVAGDGPRALLFYARSAARAVRLSAFQAALNLCERAAALAGQLEASAQTARQELELLKLRSLALAALRGFGHETLRQIYQRSQSLADQLADQAASLFTDMAFWGFVSAGNYERGLELATHLSARARRSKDNEYLANSALARGVSLLHLGQPSAAARAMQQAVSAAARSASMGLVPGVAVDAQVVILCNLARALWFRGKPDSALQAVLNALTMARQRGHHKTIAYALTITSDIHHLRRDPARVLPLAEEVIEMSGENSFFYEGAWASALRAAALTTQGNPEEGCRLWEQLRQYQGPCKTKFLAHSARAYGMAGQPSKALEILDEAFQSGRDRREHYYDAELHRLRGEILLLKRTDPGSREAARESLQEAIAVARRQRSTSFELRAHSSLLRYTLRFDRNAVPGVAAAASSCFSHVREGGGATDSTELFQLLTEAGHRPKVRSV